MRAFLPSVSKVIDREVPGLRKTPCLLTLNMLNYILLISSKADIPDTLVEGTTTLLLNLSCILSILSGKRRHYFQHETFRWNGICALLKTYTIYRLLNTISNDVKYQYLSRKYTISRCRVTLYPLVKPP